MSFLTGCPSEKANAPTPTATASADAPKAVAAAGPVAEAVHDVTCGCVIPEVKKCGEWVKVNDTFIELTNHGLEGAMPFCGKKDLKANVAGEIKDGKLVASKVEVLPK
jgi:hypothetical protein